MTDFDLRIIDAVTAFVSLMFVTMFWLVADVLLRWIKLFMDRKDRGTK